MMTPFEPVSQIVLQSGLSIFNRVSLIMMGFVGLFFTMRIVFSALRIAPPSEYGEILIDVATYYAFINLYPMLMSLLANMIEGIAEQIHSSPPSYSETVMRFLTKFLVDMPFVASMGELGEIAMLNFVGACYSALIGVLMGIAPILIFTGTVLKMGHGIQKYFLALLSVMMWPIVWNLLGLLESETIGHVSTADLRPAIYVAVFMLFKLVSPFFSLALFSSLGIGSGLAMAKRIAMTNVKPYLPKAAGVGGQSFRNEAKQLHNDKKLWDKLTWPQQRAYWYQFYEDRGQVYWGHREPKDDKYEHDYNYDFNYDNPYESKADRLRKAEERKKKLYA